MTERADYDDSDFDPLGNDEDEDFDEGYGSDGQGYDYDDYPEDWDNWLDVGYEVYDVDVSISYGEDA